MFAADSKDPLAQATALAARCAQLESGFRVAGWEVEPRRNRIFRPGAERQLEAKVMDLLVVLAAADGQTVSKNDLLAAVWPRTVVVDGAIYRVIRELRQILDDDARNPRIIENVPKRGYRLVASLEARAPRVLNGATVTPVRGVPESRSMAAGASLANPLRRHVVWVFATAALALILITWLYATGAPTRLNVAIARSALITHPLRFAHFGLDEGLAELAVHAIAEDADGLLWIGTEEGLDRYDGSAFQHWRHDPANPGSLANNYVTDIQFDQAGALWLAADGVGLVRRDPRSGVFSPLVAHNTAGLERLRVLRFDHGGNLWMGSRDAGVAVFEPQSQSLVRFRHDTGDPHSLSHDSITALLVDRRGVAWVGTDAGIDRVAGRKGIERVYVTVPATSLSVRALLEDSQGAIWAGCAKGLMRLDPTNDHTEWFRHEVASPHSLPEGQVNALLEDRHHQLWVGTDHGLALFDWKRRVFEIYRHDPDDLASLPDDHVLSLHEDHAGRVWVGTRFGGLAMWKPDGWSFGHHPGMNVMAFTEDRARRLWIGSLDGLVVLDKGGNSQRIAHLSDQRVMALLTDRNGTVWAGTMGGGLNRIDPDRFEVATYPYDLNDPHSVGAAGIMSLLEDSAGQLWIGTYGGGLSRFNPITQEFVRYTPDTADPNKLASGRITALAEDRNGRIWAGTDGGGLHVLDPVSGKFYRLPHDPHISDTLSSDTVYSLYIDRDGTAWIGTRGGGLDRALGSSLEPAAIRFRNYSERDGLPNNTIYGIYGDAARRLWLSTNRGLVRFDPRTGTVLTFHREHGLQGDEFNFGAHYRTAAGELLFGGPNGYNRFEP